MAIRVAINGFGRIGRLVMRAALEHAEKQLEIVGINDLGPVETNAHLLRYDSVHGRFGGEVTTGENWMDAGRGKIRVTAERDPAKLPWKELGVDVALECTGIFTKREAAAKHLEAGAKKVIISAPGEGADLTVVMGVNHDELSAKHQVISNASCTTNCLAPVAYVLHQGIGIERGYMTTIHSYTGDQSLQDTLHSDLRRARAAALSLIPTSTGAARAVGLVLPALKGKLDGTAIRVPTANVSLIDLTFDAARETTAEEVNTLMEDAAKSNRLKGIVGINKAPTVSVDFNHDSHSSTFDVTQTQVLDKKFVRVLSWYDNEWGFSNRMVEVAAHFGAMH
ncbi:MAG TPA: type I glyceraldehyde-3-phosphate dehydrogenase [Stellaceae bacterium]|nr:type I glyceraldehyde-3-phosphate dehydrogenase [Stellaceae bacterium]